MFNWFSCECMWCKLILIAIFLIVLSSLNINYSQQLFWSFHDDEHTLMMIHLWNSFLVIIAADLQCITHSLWNFYFFRSFRRSVTLIMSDLNRVCVTWFKWRDKCVESKLNSILLNVNNYGFDENWNGDILLDLPHSNNSFFFLFVVISADDVCAWQTFRNTFDDKKRKCISISFNQMFRHKSRKKKSTQTNERESGWQTAKSVCWLIFVELSSFCTDSF